MSNQDAYLIRFKKKKKVSHETQKKKVKTLLKRCKKTSKALNIPTLRIRKGKDMV